MQYFGFAEIQRNCKGVPLYKSIEIFQNSMKFNENTKKMQRKCNVAASSKFNEIARGYPYKKLWKSIKI